MRRRAEMGDERRLGRGAWLTLALAALLFAIPLVSTLLGLAQPGDGWATWTYPLYVLRYNLSGHPSPLRAGAVVEDTLQTAHVSLWLRSREYEARR